MSIKIINITVPGDAIIPDVLSTFSPEENYIMLKIGSETLSEGRKVVANLTSDEIFKKVRNDFEKEIEKFQKEDGAKVFIKKVPNPERFGVTEVKGNKIINIEEKPKKPKSNLITTGFYLYNFDVFQKIKKLKPSKRGELELTDVHNMYIKEGRLSFALVKGYWSDAGTFESLSETSNWVMNSLKRKIK